MGEQPQAERPRRRARAAILAQTPPSAEDAFAVLSENSTATDLIAFVGKWGQRNVAAAREPTFEYDRNVWGGGASAASSMFLGPAVGGRIALPSTGLRRRSTIAFAAGRCAAHRSFAPGVVLGQQRPNGSTLRFAQPKLAVIIQALHPIRLKNHKTMHATQYLDCMEPRARFAARCRDPPGRSR